MITTEAERDFVQKLKEFLYAYGVTVGRDGVIYNNENGEREIYITTKDVLEELGVEDK